MSDCNSTGTVRGSEHPAVADLIRDSIDLWFGSREPDQDHRETITAEALAGMLHRVADRSYNAGRADAAPTVTDIVEETHVEDSLWRIDALLNGISALVRDRDFQIEPDSIQRLGQMAQGIVHKLLLPGGES